MANTIGAFDYQLIASKKGDQIPFDAIIHIVPKRFSRDEDGWPRLSPELMSAQEIDSFIRACKEDLDYVGHRAKRALQRANKRTRKRISDN